MQKLKRLLIFARNFLPSQLPRSGAQLTEFMDDIFLTYGLPSTPGYRQAIATMIMHLGPTISHKPKRYFAKAVFKAQANQVAYELLDCLKREAAEQQAKEQASEKTKSEATPA